MTIRKAIAVVTGFGASAGVGVLVNGHVFWRCAVNLAAIVLVGLVAYLLVVGIAEMLGLD